MLRALIATLAAASSATASEAVTASTLENYHSWGWQSVVVSNGLVTLAVVPAIGGRVM